MLLEQATSDIQVSRVNQSAIAAMLCAKKPRVDGITYDGGHQASAMPQDFAC